MKTSTLRLLVLIAVSVLPAFTGPIVGGPCQTGTVAEYLALGDGGCLFPYGGVTLIASGFGFSLNGKPLSNDLLIVPDYDNPIFRIPLNLLLEVGETIEFAGQVNITGPLFYGIGMDLYQFQPPGPVSYTQYVHACVDAPFVNSACSGTSLEYDIGQGFPDYVTGSTSGMMGITSITLFSPLGGGMNLQNVVFGGLTVPYLRPVELPEPSSLMLVGFVLVGIAARSASRLRKKSRTQAG